MTCLLFPRKEEKIGAILKARLSPQQYGYTYTAFLETSSRHENLPLRVVIIHHSCVFLLAVPIYVSECPLHFFFFSGEKWNEV